MPKTVEEQRAYNRQAMARWRAANPERNREISRAHRARHGPRKFVNTPERQAYMAVWRVKHADRERARRRAHYLKNREQNLAKGAARRAATKDHTRQVNALWYLANKAKVAAQVLAWARAHPEVMAHRRAQRRARKRGNGGSHTLAEWRDRVDEYGGLCAYCRAGGKMTRDHIVPLSRGGADHIENIVPACGSCNSRKGTRTGAEFVAA